MEKVVESENGSISSIDAANLPSSLPDGVRMSLSEAEDLVNRLVEDKWVVHGSVSFQAAPV